MSSVCTPPAAPTPRPPRLSWWQEAGPGILCLVVPLVLLGIGFLVFPPPRYHLVEKRVITVLDCAASSGYCRVRFEDGSFGSVRFPLEGRTYLVRERVK